MDWRSLFGNRVVKLVSAGTFIASAFMIQPYRPMFVVGRSMLPTYKNNEFALVSTNTSDLKRGDVVVLETLPGTLVKRVAYLPGDWITYFKFAGEWVYGKSKIVENLKHPERFPQRKVRVPEGYVFVLGDNPDVSIDSRQLGVLPIDSIRAKLVDPKPKSNAPIPEQTYAQNYK